MISVPQYFYSTDSPELGKALIAWRYGLLHQEVELLIHIAEGLTNEQIAGKMASAEVKTVKSRIKRLYIKLRVTNRIEAAVLGVQFGLLPPKVAGKVPE